MSQELRLARSMMTFRRIRQVEIAVAIRRSVGYTNEVFTGKRSPTLDEAQTISERLRLPVDLIFPNLITQEIRKDCKQ